MDATKFFRQMVTNWLRMKMPYEQSEWVFGFRRRCTEKLESSGDTAVSDERNGIRGQRPLVEALNDANKVIELDPLSPWGYERKHTALHKARDSQNAFDAFEAMLSRMLESSDAEIRSLHIDPGETRETIRRLFRMPLRLATSAHQHPFCDKSQQAVSFESHAVFKKDSFGDVCLLRALDTCSSPPCTCSLSSSAHS
ncbi:hypothetical protein V8E55_007480 [Tylopilus felleus]